MCSSVGYAAGWSRYRHLGRRGAWHLNCLNRAGHGYGFDVALFVEMLLGSVVDAVVGTVRRVDGGTRPLDAVLVALFTAVAAAIGVGTMSTSACGSMRC